MNNLQFKNYKKMARNIEVYSSQTNSTETISFEGETFGELLDELGLSAADFTGAGGTTKSTYIAEDAIISPEDDFIAIYPTKMKAGNGTRYSDAALRELHTKLTNVISDLLDDKDLEEIKISSKSNKTEKAAAKARELAKGMRLS